MVRRLQQAAVQVVPARGFLARKALTQTSRVGTMLRHLHGESILVPNQSASPSNLPEGSEQTQRMSRDQRAQSAKRGKE